MKFETKYNIGDDFWVMRDNKPEKFNINRIVVSQFREPNGSGCYIDRVDIFYYGGLSPREEFVAENEIYQTKEDLLKTL